MIYHHNDDSDDDVRAICTTVPKPCRSPMFSCRNEQCALMEWVLDGSNDCGDGTDEGKARFPLAG